MIRVAPRVPYPDSFYYSEPWPFPSLDVLQSYERSSPISAWVVYALGLEQSAWLALFRIGIALVCVGVAAWWVWMTLDVPSQRARAVRLLVLSPVMAVLILILGSYDAFTVLGLGLMLVAWRHGSRAWLVVAGVYLGVQHFEQAVVSVAALALASWALRDRLPARLAASPSPVWALLGAAVGKGLLLGALALSGVPPLEGRAHWLTDPYLLKQAIVGAVNFGPILLASLFAGLWALVVWVLTLLRPTRSLVPALGAIALLAVVSVFTLDHTRVFAVTSLPLLALLIVVGLRSEEAAAHGPVLVVVEAMAWLIPPLLVEGVATVYTTPQNALDQWLVFLGEYLPFG